MTDMETAMMSRSAEQVSRRVVAIALNKIKAEIEQEYNCLSATRADETLELGECLGLKMALKIVNKYKTESEK